MKLISGIQTPCLTCGAKAGVPCTTVTGRKASIHESRKIECFHMDKSETDEFLSSLSSVPNVQEEMTRVKDLLKPLGVDLDKLFTT